MSDVNVASGDVRLRVRGLNRTIRALSQAGADSEDMRALMHAIGMLIVEEAKPKVPKQVGTLANTLRAGRGKTKAVVRAGGAKAPYAGVIHYGWPARNIEKQPFLIDAISKRHADVINTLDQGLADILKKNDLE